MSASQASGNLAIKTSLCTSSRADKIAPHWVNESREQHEQKRKLACITLRAAQTNLRNHESQAQIPANIQQPGGNVNTGLAWAMIIFLPNVLLYYWMFDRISPIEYLTQVYQLDLPFLLQAPLAGVCVSALCAWWLSKSKLNPNPPLTARVVLLTVGVECLLAFIAAAALLGYAFVSNLIAVAAGGVIVTAAIGLGLRILEFPLIALGRERFASALERLVVAAALGLGALALLVFLLGSLGVLNAWLWRALILGLCLQSFHPLQSLVLDLYASACTFKNQASPVALAALAFTLLYILAHLPLLWASPTEYDILEYHLAAPAQYLRDGQISFLHENLLANMPANGEMLYLVAMLTCGKWRGLPAAHTLLFAAWVLAICGVYALASRLTNVGRAASPSSVEYGKTNADNSPAAALGAFLYALIPLGSALAGDFYVEHFQALFHLAALMAGCAFLCERARRETFATGLGWLVLAGCAAGFCCGTKYTALLLTLVPMSIFIPFIFLLEGNILDGLRAVSCIFASAGCVFSPWLMRNLLASDDPIYPIGGVLGRRLFRSSANPGRLDHFEADVRTGARSGKALLNSLRQLIPGMDELKNWRPELESCGPQILCFALPGFLSIKRPAELLVAGTFILDLMLWFLFTHRLNRFFFPVLSPLAVLGALGVARLWRVNWLRSPVAILCMGLPVLIGPVPMLYVWLLSNPAYFAGQQSPREAAQQDYHIHGDCGAAAYDAWQGINNLPAESKVLFMGDSQTFYLDKTPVYSTVFNSHLLEELIAHSDNAAMLASLLSARGVTHLYINYSEWVRLDASYALKRSDAQSPWQLASMNGEKRMQMRQLLQSGHMRGYGDAWPEGIRSAYLKLSPKGYAILEDLFLRHTVVESIWGENHRNDCELRRLTQFER